ncbi:hypothetical protein PROPHIGD03_1_9 [Mycobacterium phage prophiGD03-1]|nr:hypothetical protein PROPHIGD03_1_9 [Mycobacterium phage prophiGD03-1]
MPNRQESHRQRPYHQLYEESACNTVQKQVPVHR